LSCRQTWNRLHREFLIGKSWNTKPLKFISVCGGEGGPGGLTLARHGSPHLVMNKCTHYALLQFIYSIFLGRLNFYHHRGRQDVSFPGSRFGGEGEVDQSSWGHCCSAQPVKTSNSQARPFSDFHLKRFFPYFFPIREFSKAYPKLLEPF
jgi:hypothetical protein